MEWNLITTLTNLIIGGNTGIGYETALDLGRRGAVIIMGCRNIKKANNAALKIRTASKESVHVIELDLASLSSVRKFANEVSKITSKLKQRRNSYSIRIDSVVWLVSKRLSGLCSHCALCTHCTNCTMWQQEFYFDFNGFRLGWWHLGRKLNDLPKKDYIFGI